MSDFGVNQSFYIQRRPAALQFQGVNGEQPQVVPNMTGQLQNTSMAKALDKSQADKSLTLALTLPAWFGLSRLDKWVKKASVKAYDESLIGKIAKFGDRVSASPFGTTVGKGFNAIGNFGSKLINKSKVLSAMIHTPSVPESKFVRDQAKGAVEEVTKNIFTNLSGGNVASKRAFLEEVHSLGLTNKDIKLMKADPKAYFAKIEQLCQGKPALSADLNRLKAMTQSSKFGNFLAKASNRGLHGITFGGGLFMIMSAHAIAEAAVRAKNAEKGDKFSTFMEAFLGNISWVVTIPLGIKLMNAVAGLKNIGKTPTQVADIAKKLAKVNKLATTGTKAEYDAAKAAWKTATKAGNANFIQKLFKLPGKILSFGRGVCKPYLPKATTFTGKVGNFFKKIPYNLRNKPIAVLIGLGTYMLVFSPFVDKVFRKVSYALFGKPKHSMYDEEEQKPQETQQPQPDVKPQTNDTKVTPTSPTNLLNMYQNGEKYNPFTNSTTTNNNVVNQENSQDGKVLEPVRTYIPSPQAVNLPAKDESAVLDAIKRSEMAEKLAYETLNMKY